MLRRFLMLTKSWKHKGYCIAGIDIDTGEWLRLNIVGNENKGIDSSHFTYLNYLTPPRPLQVMMIEDLESKSEIAFQPENIEIPLKAIRKIDVEDKDINALIQERLHKDFEHDNIFYDTNFLISSSDLAKKNMHYSLMFAEVSNVEVEIRTKDNGQPQFLISFTFNGARYNKLRVTDPEFRKILITTGKKRSDGTYFIEKDLLLVISLGEEFNGAHYKLVASVFTYE